MCYPLLFLSCTEITNIASFSPEIHWQTFIEPYFPYLLILWGIGILLLSIRMGMGYFQLGKLRKTAVTPLPDAWMSIGKQLAQRLGISKNIAFLSSELIGDPLTLGHLKPVVLIPAGMLLSLTPDQLEAILAHELAHIKRADFLINLIQSVIEILFFFHPVVWWISREIRREREACCDDLAVQLCGDAYVYASALTQVQMLRSTFQPLLTMNASGANHQFTRRMKRLFLSMPQTSAIRSRVSGAMIAVLIVLGLSFRLLGQTEEDKTLEFLITSETTKDEIYTIKQAFAEEGAEWEAFEVSFDAEEKLKDLTILSMDSEGKLMRCIIRDLQEATLKYDPGKPFGITGKATGQGEMNCESVEKMSFVIQPTTSESEISAHLKRLPAGTAPSFEVRQRTALGNIQEVVFSWDGQSRIGISIPAQFSFMYSQTAIISADAMRLNQGPDISKNRVMAEVDQATWQENLTYAQKILANWQQEFDARKDELAPPLTNREQEFVEEQLNYVAFLYEKINQAGGEGTEVTQLKDQLSNLQQALATQVVYEEEPNTWVEEPGSEPAEEEEAVFTEHDEALATWAESIVEEMSGESTGEEEEIVEEPLVENLPQEQSFTFESEIELKEELIEEPEPPLYLVDGLPIGVHPLKNSPQLLEDIDYIVIVKGEEAMKDYGVKKVINFYTKGNFFQSSEAPNYFLNKKPYSPQELQKLGFEFKDVELMEIQESAAEGGSVPQINMFTQKGVNELHKQAEKPNELIVGTALKTNAYPNPFSDQVTIEVNLVLVKNAKLSIDVLTQDGRKVQSILDQTKLKKGTHKFDWTPQGISPGNYLIRVQSSIGTSTLKVQYQGK